MTTSQPTRHIAFIGNYAPRRCGIATFTTDICEAIADEFPAASCFAGAMNDRPEGYDYPPRVRFEIDQNDPDNSRVLVRSFIPGGRASVLRIIERALPLTADEIMDRLALLHALFDSRNKRIDLAWRRHYDSVRHHVPHEASITDDCRLYIGALLSGEYALESAALFNPDPSFRRGVFFRKLREMESKNDWSRTLRNSLADRFTRSELSSAIRIARGVTRPFAREAKRTTECIRWLAEANYEVHFDPAVPVSERIIFPVSPNESNGMEDARFVLLRDDDGSVTYYATYTAYNGRSTATAPGDHRLPKLPRLHPAWRGGPQQGHGALSPQGRREVCDDLPPG
jgi:hypothetical protein